VINTCAVTSEAARDARSRTRRIHRANPEAEIMLTGCYATIAPAELAAVHGAGRVVVNQQKAQLVQMIDPQVRIDLPVYDQEPVLREYLAGSMGAHTRAFIKVQDGCNNKCTFCVTTVARGEGQSRHLGDVVAEIQALAAAGYQEAVLSGVHLGSYGYDFSNKAGLRELVAAILDAYGYSPPPSLFPGTMGYRARFFQIMVQSPPAAPSAHAAAIRQRHHFAPYGPPHLPRQLPRPRRRGTRPYP
jgi:threonylcarbamoyladenosine tRNA methylthiotransferase MtaB